MALRAAWPRAMRITNTARTAKIPANTTKHTMRMRRAFADEDFFFAAPVVVVGLSVGLALVGLGEGAGVANVAGVGSTDGDDDGAMVGGGVGFFEGAEVGCWLGESVGACVGAGIGTDVGAADGGVEGIGVGGLVGIPVGAGVGVNVSTETLSAVALDMLRRRRSLLLRRRSATSASSVLVARRRRANCWIADVSTPVETASTRSDSTCE